MVVKDDEVGAPHVVVDVHEEGCVGGQGHDFRVALHPCHERCLCHCRLSTFRNMLYIHMFNNLRFVRRNCT